MPVLVARILVAVLLGYIAGQGEDLGVFSSLEKQPSGAIHQGNPPPSQSCEVGTESLKDETASSKVGI